MAVGGGARCGERKGEQTFTCVRNYSRTSGVQMLRMRCVRHVMPSGSSCKVKGPSPPEGVGGGSGRGGVWGGGAGDPQDNNSLRRLGECRHCRAFSFSGSNLILNGD